MSWMDHPLEMQDYEDNNSSMHELNDYGATPAPMSKFNKVKGVFGGRNKKMLFGIAIASLAFAMLITIFSEAGSGHNRWHPSHAVIPVSVMHDMNTMLSPCKDFYKFSCGGWERRTKIPADATEMSRAWDPVIEKNRASLRKFVKEDTGIAGRFYRSCMDTGLINSLGNKPLQAFSNAIELIAEPNQLVHVLATFHSMNVPCLFDWQITPDPIDVSKNAMILMQGGLTLPTPEYYLSKDKDIVKQRGEYRALVQSVLELLGMTPDDAEEQSHRVLKVETKLAKLFGNPTTERKSVPHHRFDMDGLRELQPVLNFPLFFGLLAGEHANIGRTRKNVLVMDVDYFRQLDLLFGPAGLNDLKPYLRFRLAYLMGSDLSNKFMDQGLKLSEIMLGVKSTVIRWKKCMESTNTALPHAVGKLYVEKTLGAKAVTVKTAAKGMAESIRAAFRQDLMVVPWMDKGTRKAAIEKLDNMLFEIAFPDQWDTYDFDVNADTFFQNVVRARAWLVRKEISKLSATVDRTGWGDTRVTDVNAFYVREVNTLFVPAGILQPPFFAPRYTSARNFGSLGAVLAHEMMHGFDDVGRLYGPNLEMADWWDAHSIKEFHHRAQCIVNLYDDLKATKGQGKVNGDLTLGDDIADMGGVKVAYRAYASERLAEDMQKAKGDPKEIQRLQKFGVPAGERQLFFISWGQTWCSAQRTKTAKYASRTDVHAPDVDRVNPPLSQLPDFAAAFSCPLASDMNPSHKCELW